MTDEEILEMLERITACLDYDLYKSIFVEDCVEDPELVAEHKEQLIDIVKEYLPL